MATMDDPHAFLHIGNLSIVGLMFGMSPNRADALVLEHLDQMGRQATKALELLPARSPLRGDLEAVVAITRRAIEAYPTVNAGAMGELAPVVSRLTRHYLDSTAVKAPRTN